MVSVIIPTHNEEGVIEQTLERLSLVNGAFEVIVVDGQSNDRTREVVARCRPRFPRPLHLWKAPRHRARQLNFGVREACGDVLLFLHADVTFPSDGILAIQSALSDNSIVGGNFDLEFEGESAWSRWFTRANRLRRRFGVYYGDSGIFVRRQVFKRLGGFREIPIMEDFDFARRLERAGKTTFLETRLTVSDRRWRVQGVWPTLASWFVIQALFSLGVSPASLARRYAPVRDGHGAEASPPNSTSSS